MTPDDRLVSLIRRNPPPPPTTREGVIEYFRPRLEAIGLKGPLDSYFKGTKIFHVAGTKGKGSTCAFIESICRANGLKTGLFTSPHLVSVRERFRINGLPVEEDLLGRYFDDVLHTLEEKQLVPGFFSFLTLVAFRMFSELQLDVIILEVGLGGRLDATNIIEKPSVCGITLLDLDHVEFLGNTIELIAGEKAGIFKNGVPAFSIDGQEDGALSVLRRVAGEVGVQSLELAKPIPGDWELGLTGSYQRANAALAVDLCKNVFPALGDQVIRQGLKSAVCKGRSEVVQDSNGNTLYLDGAHTPKSLNAAVNWVVEQIEADKGQPRENILLFNCMHSRDPLTLFAPFRGNPIKFAKVIFAPTLFQKPTKVKRRKANEILGLDTAESAQDETWQDTLKIVWDHHIGNGESKAFPDLQKALDVLSTLSNSRIFVTGSFLLVGDTMNL
eukprot:CAMPEP_0203774868 /NCGR_PEP_ID=MMETSP0099_2-20121227/5653_1 /ASSEMBLY_ACC=CAM_ASM_000209 /TAXON_ID=96639 /ORGANISM=" , Strain NY0313808BC1" /LENGTH=442 /DNA_ID=CAMNT_0050673259 /DNA_START=268 /DNA_END=1593 /DNA_ORIENTATION=-